MKRHPYGDINRQQISLCSFVHAIRVNRRPTMRFTRMMWFNAALAIIHQDPASKRGQRLNELAYAYKGKP